MEIQGFIAIFVFIATIYCIARGYLTRATATLMGASTLMFFRIIPSEIAFHFIDFNTLGLLIGMMIIVGVLSRSGLFQYVAVKAIKFTGGKGYLLLAAILFITALLSAFLDNVTTVLLISPIILSLTDLLGMNPVPFLVSEALASNIGGAATLIGDPPNIIVGSFAKLSFLDFIINMSPVALLILLITAVLLGWLFRKDIFTNSAVKERLADVDETRLIKDPALLKRSLIAMGAVLAGFMLHHVLNLEASVIALFGAGLLLTVIPLSGPDVIHTDIEWPTLVFFASLFIMVGALKETGVIVAMADGLSHVLKGHKLLSIIVILWVSGFASIFINPVAFCAIFVQVVPELSSALSMDSTPLFWALAMGACFGGNGSYLGATANAVLADLAEKGGHGLSFSYFLRIGLKVVFLSLTICTVYLLIRYRNII